VIVVAALLLFIFVFGACLVLGGKARKRLERELSAVRATSRVEELTMVRNRRAFEEDLQIEVLRCDRTGNPVCLIVVSLMPYPDQDELAEERRRELVRLMTTSVRAVDVAYRIGVDEFALILPDTRAKGGQLAAGRVVDALGTAATECRVTAGIAEGGPGIDRQELFRNAYCALLATSREGTPSVLVYSSEIERTAAGDELEQQGEIGALDEPFA
jgi:diguanylate cyclase (GGDEF)-like protein